MFVMIFETLFVGVMFFDDVPIKILLMYDKRNVVKGQKSK